jgi:REase_DpnII-MboI
MKIFGYEFEYLDDAAITDLMSLEREKVIYSDQWVDGLDDFRHVRIRLNDAEISEYVRSMKAFDLFLGCNSAWARDVSGVPPDIAARADSYQITTRDGKVMGPPWHCAAAFLGRDLEIVVCGMDSSRREVLEEQGIAGFLNAIRRSVDALTPAMRCFSNREEGLTSWPVNREDDVRDLLYVMLRASISDIKREEPVPSRAGMSRFADLHSKLARTLIEVKWIGRKGQWRRVVDDLHVDIQTYGKHPDCQFLVLVVIDAAKDLPDPHAVETDLSGSQVIDGKSVRVVAYVREP